MHVSVEALYKGSPDTSTSSGFKSGFHYLTALWLLNTKFLCTMDNKVALSFIHTLLEMCLEKYLPLVQKKCNGILFSTNLLYACPPWFQQAI